jgi:hypothetical protein
VVDDPFSLHVSPRRDIISAVPDGCALVAVLHPVFSEPDPDVPTEKSPMSTPHLRLALALLALAVGCRSRPPYEGKSVAELERMLSDSNPTVQAQGAFGLSRLGPEARSAVPALIDALKHDSIVRQHAALALGKIGPDAREAVPALTDALSDKEWTVRRQAALALGEIGADTDASRTALTKLRQDPNTLVRKAAQEALAQIHTAGKGP